jgi:hypothetical protein
MNVRNFLMVETGTNLTSIFHEVESVFLVPRVARFPLSAVPCISRKTRGKLLSREGNAVLANIFDRNKKKQPSI